jgi:hypothetical protein
MKLTLDTVCAVAGVSRHVAEGRLRQAIVEAYNGGDDASDLMRAFGLTKEELSEFNLDFGENGSA